MKKFDVQFIFLMTQEQRANIAAVAEYYGTTVSGVIRTAIDDLIELELNEGVAEGRKLLNAKKKRRETKGT